MLQHQCSDNAILTAICILVLIDKQVIKSRGLFTQSFGKPLKELFGTEQQVVKVDRAGVLQGDLVAAIRHGCQVLFVGLGRSGGGVRPDTVRFPVADLVQQVTRP